MTRPSPSTDPLCAKCGCYRSAHDEDERCEPVGWRFTEASTVTDEGLVERAKEYLAVAHEDAKKPLVAVDIRTGNLGKMGVAWVETKTALAAIEAAASGHTALLREIEVLREALSGVLSWWPEGSEGGRAAQSYGDGFAVDIRKGRAALSRPTHE